MSESKKLFLLDAYALIYRAYFAFIKNPRINTKGINTSAIFGFANTLIELIKKENPSHLAVIFDTKEPTKRHIAYPEYKANREAMPEDLQQSLPYIDKFLEALNISKLFKAGYEADDIIGTIAKKAEKEGFQVYMMTSDKDFAQLVSDNIFMYRPASKWKPQEVWGCTEVLDKFKIQNVNQVIDFLGMMGDSVDNIPGIPGIGEKTAQKLLSEYNSMEELFKNTHKLKGSLKEKVENGKDLGVLCKELVTIITNVPISVRLDEFLVKGENMEKVKNLFNELEFKRLLTRFPILDRHEINKSKISNISNGKQMNLFSSAEDMLTDESREEVSMNLNKKYKFLESQDNIRKFANSLLTKQKLAMQLIYSNGDNFFETKIIGIAFSINKNKSTYINLNSSSGLKLLMLFKPVFAREDLILVGYDIKLQIKILKNHDVEIKSTLFDIRIAYHLLNPEFSNTIDSMVQNILKITPFNIEGIQGFGRTKIKLEELDIEILKNLFSQQVDHTFQLYYILNSQLEKTEIKKLFYEIEMPLMHVLASMETEGIQLDNNMLEEYKNDLEKSTIKTTRHIFSLAKQEFNLDSPKQLGETLFDSMKLSKNAKKTKSGQYSTSEETLLKLKGTSPIIDYILDYREIKKLLSTYVKTLPNLSYKNRIHTTFNQSVVATGRLSSINPNLQNIPIRSARGKKIRESFIPKNEEYLLLSADYSQIELRIMAALSEDKVMIKAFNNNEDIHAATASKVYKVPISSVNSEMRGKAKAVNFGIIYGISAFGLSQNIGVSRTEAKKIIDEYFLEFPQIKKFIEKSIAQARIKEYVTTIFGRKRFLRDINSRNAVSRGVAERNAINTPIQGSAADIIKKAMINIQKEIESQKLKSKMLIQVHDELVFDMYKSEEALLKRIIKEKMENVVKFKAPLLVDLGVGDSWLEAH
ncbi:MAG: DNA polymerase I [Bacteroidota bacterium]|nr:DNA polymerase I [Bacteroidota bacterium]